MLTRLRQKTVPGHLSSIREACARFLNCSSNCLLKRELSSEGQESRPDSEDSGPRPRQVVNFMPELDQGAGQGQGRVQMSGCHPRLGTQVRKRNVTCENVAITSRMGRTELRHNESESQRLAHVFEARAARGYYFLLKW